MSNIIITNFDNNFIKRRFKIIILAIMLFTIIFESNMQVNAYTVDEEISQNSTLEYTLKDLHYGRTVQNFYIGTSYIYVTQQKVIYDDNKNIVRYDTILSRCLINPSNKTATYVDHMILKDFGHGETLDLYNYNEKTYFLVGCQPFKNTSTGLSDTIISSLDKSSATQLTRVEYSAGDVVEYLNLPRIGYMNYANTTTTRLGTTTRVVGVYSSAYDFIFRIQTVSSSGDVKVTYSVYDGDTINSALDKGNVKLIDMASACKRSFSQTSTNIVRPYNALQGMEVRQNGCIYVSGDNSSSTNISNKPKIAKMSTSGTALCQSEISNLLHTDEIEGLQIKGYTMYFVVFSTADVEGMSGTEIEEYKNNYQKICSVDLF